MSLAYIKDRASMFIKEYYGEAYLNHQILSIEKFLGNYYVKARVRLCRHLTFFVCDDEFEKIVTLRLNSNGEVTSIK